jgi:hypothetical protein
VCILEPTDGVWFSTILVCGKMKCGDCKVVAEGVRTYVEQTGRRRLAMSLKGVSVENMPF